MRYKAKKIRFFKIMFRCLQINQTRVLPAMQKYCKRIRQIVMSMENIVRIQTLEQINIMQNLFRRLNHGIYYPTPQKFLEKMKLNTIYPTLAFNSGQIHHRAKQSFKDQLENIGFITKSHVITNNKQQGYRIFGKQSVLFPLKNESNEIINLCALSLENGKTTFLNFDGLYPNYPKKTAHRLILAPTVVETATILEANAIKENEAVISLFNGELKQQHLDAIRSLKKLKEIIITGNISFKNDLL